jgi:hypothetical protein
MFCPQCGTAQAEGARFCIQCGTGLTAAPEGQATLADLRTMGSATAPGAGEDAYLNALRAAWRDEVITAEERQMLDSLRAVLGLDPTRAAALEQEVQGESTGARREALSVEQLPIGFELDGRYVITRLLGEGGMGAVYRATDKRTRRDYAVKLLAPTLLQEPGALRQLEHEVATAHGLIHSRLCTIFDLKGGNQLPYLVMEYIDGTSLEVLYREGKLLSLARFHEVAAQILEGIEFLHDRGFVHKDLKPSNIMLTTTGEVKLIDFGITRSIREQVARREEGQGVAGTPHFMAPEQLRGEICDRRTDLYALGILFYRLLTNGWPFEAATVDDVTAWHLGPAFTGERVTPVAWRDFFTRSLARDPQDRFQTCYEMRAALRALQAEQAPAVQGQAGGVPEAHLVQHGTSAPATATTGELTRQQVREALRILRGYLPQDDLHVSPNIPERKLRNATRSCGVEDDEQVLALIDATVFGSAKNCLLVGTRGLYCRNDWAGRSAGAHHVGYLELLDTQVRVEGSYEVQIGPGTFFNHSGSSIKGPRVVQILQDLTELFR